MPKRSILLILFLVVAVAIVGIVMVLWPKPEPEYEGRKLSECVIELAKPTTMAEIGAAKEAIRQMGTNALPYLIQWVGYETPALKKQVSWVAIRIFRKLPPWQMTEQTHLLQRQGAVFALQMVGREAAPGIPNLSRIANDPKRSESRLDVVWVLGEIGAAALPAIVCVLTNEQSRTAQSPKIRMGCALIISHLAHEDLNTARLAVPALLKMRDDPDQNARGNAIIALHEIDPKWREKLPKATNY